MTLDKNDAKLLYELWFPLLDYANKKYMVSPHLKKIYGTKELDPSEVKMVADHGWEHISVIDEYLSDYDLPDEYRSIVLRLNIQLCKCQ